jgi:hypothetical protein
MPKQMIWHKDEVDLADFHGFDLRKSAESASSAFPLVLLWVYWAAASQLVSVRFFLTAE